ncbi:hypothetical protein KIW84_055573 [Lathyrus oleraceus]|uniref:Uncharacterized protein n=1 Tax=Pisum sativum TaxID=3888 RepID=A0A9D5AJY0_PEA|nr:hypothetical protein KIW84_055573 [Pisum sativum]
MSETGRPQGDSFEPLTVKQGKKHISIPVPHDSYSVLPVSNSGKYLAIVWPDIPCFSVYKGSSSKRAKEVAAAAAGSSDSVQVRTVLDDGTSNILMRFVVARNEPVIGLHGGALLGVAYRTSRRTSPGFSLPDKMIP